MVIGRKSRNYERKIMEEHLFEPIMITFRNNSNRNNMINSAILELFWIIDQEYNGSRKLVATLVEKYRDDFEKINYVNTFRSLITKYEQQKENNSHELLT